MGRGKAEAQRPAKSALNMSEDDTLLALETLAKTLDVEIRYEKGDFTGGLCRVDEKSILLLQKADPARRKISVLARELGAFNLDQIFVMPALRALIEEEVASAQPIESDQNRT
jgi:hypothetical protein